MVIHAGLLGERYGKLPSEVLKTSGKDFWLNVQSLAAVDEWREERRQQADRASSDAGSATPAQKERLVDRQQWRADEREDLADQGGVPDPDDQLAALEDKREAYPADELPQNDVHADLEDDLDTAESGDGG